MRSKINTLTRTLIYIVIIITIFSFHFIFRRAFLKRKNLKKFEETFYVNSAQALSYLNKSKLCGLDDDLYYNKILDLYDYYGNIEGISKTVNFLENICKNDSSMSDKLLSDILCHKAFLKSRTNNFDDKDILELYNQSLLHNPENHRAFMNRAYYSYYKKNYLSAFTDIDKAIEIIEKYDLRNHTYYQLRGALQSINNNYEEALIDFNKEVELTPFNSMPLTALAFFLLENKNYDEAAKTIIKIVELFPEYSIGYLLGAVYAYKLKEKDRYNRHAIWFLNKHRSEDKYFELTFTKEYAPSTFDISLKLIIAELSNEGIDFSWP